MKIAALILAIGVVILALSFVRRQRADRAHAGADGGGGGAEFAASDTGHCSADASSDGGCDGGGDCGGGGDGGGGGGD